MYDVRFKTPCNILVVGSSGSGKTQCLKHFIEQKDALFDYPPEHVIFFYEENQDMYKYLKKKNLVDVFVQGLPTSEELKDVIDSLRPSASNEKKQPILCIYDDLVQEVNAEISKIFTVYGHHLSLINIFVTQELFAKNSNFRTMSLNSHYLILFKLVRDVSQILPLARQISPFEGRFIIESYKAATSKPYSYLLFDFHQTQDDILRLRSNIFLHEDPMIVYVKKPLTIKNEETRI